LATNEATARGNTDKCLTQTRYLLLILVVTGVLVGDHRQRLELALVELIEVHDLRQRRA
jgi:hypothetical protein